MSPDAVETDLLAAIAAEPDAIEPRLIYGDWLQAQSDPRGELIVVQAERLAKPDDVELAARERALTTELAGALIRATADAPIAPSVLARWHLGFVDKLALDIRTIRLLRTTHRAWFAQPAFAAVRELDIDSKYARNLRFVRHLALAPTVRRLAFGRTDATLEEPTLAAIASRLPKLAGLHLRASEVPPLRALRALKLRELTLQIGRLDEPGLARILEEPWTSLETFGLRAERDLAEDAYPMLAQLYNGASLASVKHYVVGRLRLIDVLEALVTSKRVETVASFTGDFQRAPYDELVRVERHRAALAHVRFAPLIGQGTYYDNENVAATASFLNYRLDRPGDALVHYEQVLRDRPDHGVARHGMAVALRKLKRLDESLVAFDTLIERSKNPSASWLNGRHYTLCELGRHADARADLERAVKIDPNHADAWNNLGVERQYIGDVDGAFEAFRRCLALDADHGYARRNEADLLLELARAGEALPIYEQLLARKPGDATLLAMIAHAQIELGEVAAARATLDRRFADPDPPPQRLYVLRALALRALGEPATADLDTLAASTDCPAWYAIALYIRTLDDAATWTRAVPATAITPREIADAITVFGRTARPANATMLHDANVDDQLDCSEIAIGAALRAGDRGLAVQRARAAAALHVEQGPRFFRAWWQVLATAMVATTRDLPDDARALLWRVIRAVRGRGGVDDVLALA